MLAPQSAPIGLTTPTDCIRSFHHAAFSIPCTHIPHPACSPSAMSFWSNSLSAFSLTFRTVDSGKSKLRQICRKRSNSLPSTGTNSELCRKETPELQLNGHEAQRMLTPDAVILKTNGNALMPRSKSAFLTLSHEGKMTQPSGFATNCAGRDRPKEEVEAKASELECEGEKLAPKTGLEAPERKGEAPRRRGVERWRNLKDALYKANSRQGSADQVLCWRAGADSFTSV